jgi:hypothetical protein
MPFAPRALNWLAYDNGMSGSLRSPKFLRSETEQKLQIYKKRQAKFDLPLKGGKDEIKCKMAI